jgi:hypothetical protein
VLLLPSSVVSFGKALVSEEFRVDTFQVSVTLLLYLLNTIAVSLERLVTRCVILLFNHFKILDWRAGTKSRI